MPSVHVHFGCTLFMPFVYKVHRHTYFLILYFVQCSVRCLWTLYCSVCCLGIYLLETVLWYVRRANWSWLAHCYRTVDPLRRKIFDKSVVHRHIITQSTQYLFLLYCLRSWTVYLPASMDDFGAHFTVRLIRWTSVNWHSTSSVNVWVLSIGCLFNTVIHLWF